MRTDQVEFLCGHIEEVTPLNGGAYGRQLRVGVSMGSEQIKLAILNLLGGMPEQDAYNMLRSEFPEWFTEAA